jgi:hypothetical protein
MLTEKKCSVFCQLSAKFSLSEFDNEVRRQPSSKPTPLAQLPGPFMPVPFFGDLNTLKPPQNNTKNPEEDELIWARKILDDTSPHYLPHW